MREELQAIYMGNQAAPWVLGLTYKNQIDENECWRIQAYCKF